MRKVLCFLACAALLLGAAPAYENYHDILAGGLFCPAVIPSAMANEKKGK